MAQGKPKRYSDEHLKLLEAGVVVYPGDESFIENMRAKGVWQGGPTVTWDEFWEVSDQDVVDPAANRRDKRPRLEGDPFSQPLSIEERRMVDPTHAYPGHVRLGAPGPVTPGRQFPSEDEGKGIIGKIAESGGALNLPSAKNIWEFGGAVGAPSASDIVGGVGDFLGLGENTAVAQPSPQVDRPQPEPTITETITQVDDETVPDKRVIKKDYKPNFERFTPGQDVGMVDPSQAYPGTVRLGAPGPVTPAEDPLASTAPQQPLEVDPSDPQVILARTLGMPVDALTAGINALVRAAGGPDQLINNPVLGSRWLMENKGLTAEELGPLIKQIITEDIPSTVKPLAEKASQFVEENLYPNQISKPGGLVEDALEQADAGADVEKVLGDEGAGLLSFPGDADEMGVAAPDTRVPPQLEKAVEKPKEDASTVGGSEVIDPATKAELEREWGKWTYKPRERREKFMSQLNRIYMKAAWLDAIAALTGGQSRSPQYIERAVGKLETMTKFDQEERVYNIWHDVYYDENGNYDPPKSKKEASERARKLGASPQETKAIYGWAEEGEDLQQWYRYVDDKLEVTTVEGKKNRPPQGDTDVQWRMGTPSDRAPATRTWTNWTDGKMTIYLPAGTSPADKGLVGMDWRKGSASESSGWSPSWKKEIGMLEKIAITDREEAIQQAASALRDVKYSHLYEEKMDRMEAAEFWVDEILANYEARGNIGIMEAETAEPAAAGPAKEYATLEEAEAAAKAGTLHKKDRVIIGGVAGHWE
jgi:hypothetical protein